MRDQTQTVTVSVGEANVTLHRSGQSRPVVAEILGMEKDDRGMPVTIWLDRLVHKPGESRFVGWGVSGAISSILRRAPAAPAAKQ